MKMNARLLLLQTAILISANALTQPNPPPKLKTRKFIDQSSMDLTIKPGNDFYEYANGTWLKNNPVPAKETRWGSFNQLLDFNINAVKIIVTEASNNASAASGSIEKRVGDFYAAGMDSLTIEHLEYTPIQGDLQRIKSLNTITDVLNETAFMRTSGAGSPMFNFLIDQDQKNVTNMIPQLTQGGITLPDQGYYIKSDVRTVKIQEAYKNYIIQLFTLTGVPEATAQKNAETVFSIEKGLATSQMSKLELRDPYKTYNKLAVADLSKTTSNIDWKSLLAKMKVNGQDTILVSSLKFFTDLNSMLTQIPVSDWQTYLQWNILKNAAPYLSSPFVNAKFAFNNVLNGQKVQTPRWQSISSLTDGSIGELLGQLYIKKHFKPEAKVRMEELVNNLRKAFEIRIQKLDWMSDITKQKALAKLHAFNHKIAYPNKFKTYDGLEINRSSFFQNIRNSGKWTYNAMVNLLGKPVDRARWKMTPATVNAYYDPTMNEIVFPAGILQFPFFDPNADDAVNYGGIGAVIGHEMSHGFDDQGSQYDKDGTLRNWWTAEDLAKFKEKAKALGAQYDAYTVLDNIHVNGKFTMGENIGDLGGLNIAYEAFKMTEQGQSNVQIDGFTPDQRFFLSWTQVCKENVLPEIAAQFILTDPHSPSKYRTFGPMVNMDVWYKAFNIQPGDKLYKKPEDRIQIW